MYPLLHEFEYHFDNPLAFISMVIVACLSPGILFSMGLSICRVLCGRHFQVIDTVEAPK